MLRNDLRGSAKLVVVSLLSVFTYISCGQDPSFVETAEDPSQNNSADQLGDNGDLSAKRQCAVNDNECLSGLDNGLGKRAAKSGSSSIEYIERKDQFTQLSSSSADILWIVDSSGSMGDEQNMLRSNFPSFMNSLVAQGVDFQTAVTSTDVCDLTLPSDKSKVVCPTGNGNSSYHLRGAFRGSRGNQIISSSGTPASIASTFSSYAQVGTRGSGFEHGLWAAKLALDLEKSGQNDSLRRPGSFLSIIVISDEEDDGIGLGKENEEGENFVAVNKTTFKWDHNQMIAHLNTTVGRGKFSISAITGTRNANNELCKSSHSTPVEEGTQYINAARATGGSLLSICENDWGALLSKLSEDIGVQAMQFVLKKPAKPDSLEVKVDGKIVDSGWVFVAGSNAVRFDPSAAPAAGAVIDIKYSTEK